MFGAVRRAEIPNPRFFGSQLLPLLIRADNRGMRAGVQQWRVARLLHTGRRVLTGNYCALHKPLLVRKVLSRKVDA